jgi:acyl-coenzyme A synthetase/AMP-(fatty) acid ligase
MAVTEGQLLWEPNAATAASSNVARYMHWLRDRNIVDVDDYTSLWQWSVDDIEGFWASLWKYFDILSDTPYEQVVTSLEMKPGNQWFAGSRVNLAEHILRNERPGEVALYYLSETRPLTEMHWDELAGKVRILATRMREMGVNPGDCVCSLMPNIPETVFYDGNPAAPTPDVLWKMAADTKATVFGASPTYVQVMEQLGVVPSERYDLSHLRCILCSGSPVSPENFEWFYKNVNENLWVTSQSGGTEIAGVWRHGDFIKIEEQGGCYIYGRSDSTLNRYGVRIGTAELYRTVEKLPEVADSLVVCIELPGGQFFMPMFLQLADGAALGDDLVQRISGELRDHCSPRHVPDRFYAIPEVPDTLTGKKMEVPVRKLMSGWPLEKAASRDTMKNPGAIDFFLDYVATTQDYDVTTIS